MMIATAIGSFFIALTLLDTRAPPNKAENDQSDAGRLASRSIFDRSDLIDAAVGVGLHLSARMKGTVDEIKRINANEVMIRGWVADPGSVGDALTVVVFVAGQRKAMVETKGERPDVTAALRLRFGAEKNVVFEATAACPTDAPIVIVGLGQEKQYLHLTFAKCP
jgi:hypothetical protein